MNSEKHLDNATILDVISGLPSVSFIGSGFYPIGHDGREEILYDDMRHLVYCDGCRATYLEALSQNGRNTSHIHIPEDVIGRMIISQRFGAMYPVLLSEILRCDQCLEVYRTPVYIQE